MSDGDNLPENWSDLTRDQRMALLELAESRVFWRQMWDRLGWVKQLGAILLTLAAAFTLMRDGFVHFLQGVSK